MKINGKKIDAAYVETIVIPRPDGNIAFQAKAVDYTDFEALCPQAVAPNVMKPGKNPEPDYTNKAYLEAQGKWCIDKTNFMFLESLRATKGLEWDTVVADDPSTWGNVSTELLSSGFTDSEVAKIYGIVTAINGLDDEKIMQATQAFLASQEGKHATI